ncbi:MAG TPA: DUF1330 domain-containing protein [Azoarcus taiwanensis]|nr:DUF1330 domain-containing protein [Azoarcus taiwanensis]
MANGWLVGQIRVKSADSFAQYRERVPATIAPFGGEIVFRGQAGRVLAGACDMPDIVVLRFPDLQALEAWYASAAYQSLIPLREAAFDCVLMAYEG